MLTRRTYAALLPPVRPPLSAVCRTCGRPSSACLTHRSGVVARCTAQALALAAAASVLACEDYGLTRIVPARLIARAVHVAGVH